MSMKRIAVAGCVALGLPFLWVAAAARAADDLPSAVVSAIKRINAALDQVDKALEADRLTTAQRKIEEARKALKETEDRYGGKFSPDHPDFKAMKERLTASGAKVDAATKKAAESAAGAAEATAQNEALCAEWIGKLGPFTDHANDLYLPIGADLNRLSPDDQAKCRASYEKAKQLLAEYRKVSFPLGKNTELQNVESLLLDRMKYYGQDQSREEQEQACKEWVDRLAPYAGFSTSGDKLLIAGATANPEELKARKAIYEEAKALFEEYRKAKFPLGKSSRLENIEEELQKRLDAFPAAAAESAAMISGDVGNRLDGILAYLGRDRSWVDDRTKKPPTVMERDLEPIREELKRIAATGAAGGAEISELEGKLKAIDDKNAEHRRIRAERTFQDRNRFQGPELEALKAKAVEVVKAEHKEAKILRTTVPSEDWAVEDVIEATDTTRTALRHRITRSVRAQVALKKPDGKVYLQEVYLGADKQGDGWAPLKGHTTWSDWMAEGNVGKEAPAPE